VDGVTGEQAGGTELVLPSHEEPFVRGVSTLIGGPVGRYGRVGEKRWFWTVMRVLVVLTVLSCTLGWAQKAQCRDVRNWSHNGGTYQYTRLCYSDIVALYGSEQLADGQTPYVDHAVEYPVLIGAAMELARGVATFASDSGPGKSHIAATSLFYDATIVILSLAAIATVICTGLTAGRRRIWDAALVALAPTVILHLGTNWDMLAVALASASILAWSRRRPLLGGVLLGLAIAAKLYPALFLLPLLALCVRSGKMQAWLRMVTGAVIGFVVVTLPVYLVSPSFADCSGGGAECNAVKTGPSAWNVITGNGHGTSLLTALSPWHNGGSNGVMRFYQGNNRRGADWDTLWLVLQHVVAGSATSAGNFLQAKPSTEHQYTVPKHLNYAWEGVAIFLIGLVMLLAFMAARRPRLPQLLFLTTVAFLLASKVDSPQYTLWLLPLWALARPRWREFLVWQSFEILEVVVRYQYFIHLDKPNAGVGYAWLATVVVLRDLTLVWLSGLIVRDILRPGHDPVRAVGEDDPAGGVLDASPDRPGWSATPRPGVASDDQVPALTSL
jgi:uncharacterized membrane protein